MEKVIGIDLGTTNSCVAVVENGTAVVIANRGGYKTTPSMVAMTEAGKRLVGHLAKRQAITNAENTVYSAKRLIGRKWNSPQVKQVTASASYTIVEGPHGDVRIQLRDKVYSVPEISAMVLAEMKLIAEEYLGHEVRKAVVTVPAYFNDNQRQATKDAGTIAALDVIRIINEPTAAALAYGFGRNMDRTVAVYDLGGGTFDVSILEIGATGVFKVISTAGDTFLGGEDFDSKIIDWLVDGFKSEHGIDLRKDRMALQRLKDAAEKAKIELSSVREVEINLPFIISSGRNEALHLQRLLSRAEFEKLNSMIQELKRENAALKQQNYELELKIKNYSQFDEKNRILNAEIDRLNKLLAEREEEISELRIRFSDEAALTKRINEHLALFVVLFAEIESLRKRVKDTEKEFGDFRRSSLAPYRN